MTVVAVYAASPPSAVPVVVALVRIDSLVRNIGPTQKEEALPSSVKKAALPRPSSVKVAVAEKESAASYVKVSHVKVSALAGSGLEEAVEPPVLLAASYLERYLRQP